SEGKLGGQAFPFAAAQLTPIGLQFRDFRASCRLCHHRRDKPGKCAFRFPTQAQELRRITHEPTIGTCISPVSLCVIIPIETYLTKACFHPIPDSMSLTRSNNTFKSFILPNQ